MPFLPCWWPDIAPSDCVGGAEDGIVASQVVAQVGHVVAFLPDHWLRFSRATCKGWLESRKRAATSFANSRPIAS